MKYEDAAFFHDVASLYAARSTCPRASVGCVAIRDKRIIATGYNGALSGQPHCTEIGCITDETGSCVRAVHAEANMIAFAAKQGISLNDCTLICTLSPCVACAKLIVQSGFTAVIWGRSYKSGSGADLLLQSGIHTTNLNFLSEYELVRQNKES